MTALLTIERDRTLAFVSMALIFGGAILLSLDDGSREKPIYWLGMFMALSGMALSSGMMLQEKKNEIKKFFLLFFSAMALTAPIHAHVFAKGWNLFHITALWAGIIGTVISLFTFLFQRVRQKGGAG